jgi:hypothetical protein
MSVVLVVYIDRGGLYRSHGKASLSLERAIN